MSAGISSAELLTRISFQSQGLAETWRHSSSNGVASELTRSSNNPIISLRSPSIMILPLQMPRRWIGRVNSNAAHITQAFTHPFEYTGAIVAPLIVIIAVDKIGGGRPAFVRNRAEKIFSVMSDLTLRLPQPDQKQSEQNCGDQAATKSAAKRSGHSRNFGASSLRLFQRAGYTGGE